MARRRDEFESPEGRHALVVGGSGMLGGVCLWLAAEGWQVTVLARGLDRIRALAARASAEGSRGAIGAALADYTDDSGLAAAVEGAVRRHGAPGLVVAWIHSTAPRALGIVARVVREAAGDGGSGVRLFEVVGSAGADPGRLPIDAAEAGAAGLVHRRVVLGWARTDTGGRWLTDAEIAAGVIAAIGAGAAVYQVGERGARPGA